MYYRYVYIELELFKIWASRTNALLPALFPMFIHLLEVDNCKTVQAPRRRSRLNRHNCPETMSFKAYFDPKEQRDVDRDKSELWVIVTTLSRASLTINALWLGIVVLEHISVGDVPSNAADPNTQTFGHFYVCYDQVMITLYKIEVNK